MPLTQTRWPLFVALVTGIAFVASFWYFVLENPKGEAVPASGGRYVEGVTQAPERINPLFAAANPVDADVASLVFSGLVRLGPDGTPQAGLAERWEITGNGQSYVFHLREGVAWHDGERFSAEDVIFTFEAIADPSFKGDPALAQLMQGVVVTARDPRTVEFRLEQAYAPFLAYLTTGILPAHLLSGLDASALFNAEFNASPVGTGPFRFKGRSDDGVTLVRNPTYYLGPPRIETLVLRTFADESALTAALRARDIDGALLDPATPQAEIDFLSGNAALTLHELVPTAFNMVYIDGRSPVFAELEVRQALQRGVDVERLAPGGRGVPADAGIPRASWAYTDVEVPPFDPGGAATILERAGWSRGRDGVRRKGDVRLSFTLSTTNDPARLELAEAIALQWRLIGAEVKVQALDAATFIDEHLLPRRFEAALVLVDPGPDPDPYPFWHTSQIVPPGRNLAGYSDPRLDDVLERARQTTETARRKELYELFQGYFIAAMPALPLYAPAYVYAQRTRVQGFAASLLFSPASRFYNVHEWYVRTRVAD